MDTLIEEVKNSGGIPILPKSALVMILNDKKVRHTEKHKLNIKVTTLIGCVTEASNHDIKGTTSIGCVTEGSNMQATSSNNSNLTVKEEAVSCPVWRPC